MSINNIFNKNLVYIFLPLILAEILSFLGYYFQTINFIAFFSIIILTLILSLYKLKYGLYILLAELFIGSFGYLFYFEQGGLKISIRMALWLIIMSAWFAKIILDWIKVKKLSITFFTSPYFYYFFILFIFIGWGLLRGWVLGNTISNIFFDFNNWLYFLLVFPVFSILRDEAAITTVKQIFLAAITWLSLKTLILFYFFSHDFGNYIFEVYRWVRESGVGEVTQVQGGFNRIFMQSHIFVLIGLIILLFYLLMAVIARSDSDEAISGQVRKSEIATPHSIAHNGKKTLLTSYFLLLTLFLSTILISFSRSFWIGLAVGGIAVWLIMIFKLKIKFKQFVIFNLLLLSSAILSLAICLAALKFPVPAPYGGFDPAKLLGDRATGLGEAGASSRWQLLPPLWQSVKSAPLLGKGFGALVTYKTSDPRILAVSPSGLYTTYAFEWGWLDVWLKLGLLGLLTYLAIFIKLIYDGLKINTSLSLGLTAGLAVLIAVNMFSPYVNHPLGIGYLIIAAGMIENLKFKI